MRRSASAWMLAMLVIAAHVDASPLRLTMDEAVARARAANLDPSDLDLAQAQLARSRAWLPGNPYFGAGLQSNPQPGTQSNLTFLSNYTFFLSQEFEIAGQRGKRIDAAAQRVEKERWQLEGAQQTLAAAVKQTFVQALAEGARVTLAQQNADAARRLSAVVQQRKDVSALQRIELNNVLIQETRAQRELAQAELERDDTLDALRKSLGLPADQEIELVGAMESHPKEVPPTVVLLDRARRQRPDLLAARHAAQQAEIQISVVKREAIPNVTLYGSVTQFDGNTSAGGDIAFSLPIFRRGEVELQEALAERGRNDLELRRLERELELEIVEARRHCVLAADTLVVQQRDILPKSEENLQLEQRLFERQEVTPSELIGVQIDAINARRDHVEAMESYSYTLIELERVIAGKIDPDQP